jgi:hypothetical protein
MEFDEGLGNQVNSERLVELVDALGKGPPDPTEKDEVLENTAIVIEWQYRVYETDTHGDIFSLDRAKPVVNLLLMLQARKVWPLHTLSNERVPIGQTDLEQCSDRARQIQRGGIRIMSAVFGQLSAEEMQELCSVDVP